MNKTIKRAAVAYVVGMAVWTALVVTLSGCSVVSYNRVFPKLTWYWNSEAVEQRNEKAAEKASALTNGFAEPSSWPAKTVTNYDGLKAAVEQTHP